MNVTPLPSSVKGWARYCNQHEDISVNEYLYGFALLKGSHASEWLERGFDELIKAIRNSTCGSY
jgi:hypothetical protein